MRKLFAAIGIVAVTASVPAMLAAKEPAKSRFGCIVGKEKWNAADGKCVPGKLVRKAPAAKAAKPAKAPVKKAEPKKAEPKKVEPKKAAPKKS